MSIQVRPFEAADLDGVRRLNERFEQHGIEHRVYPEDVARRAVAEAAQKPVIERLIVATDGAEIRGGGWLKEQWFWVDGTLTRAGWLKYPVAESLRDKQFAGVPASLVLQCLRLQPALMALGMGGHDQPFARILGRIGWGHSTIPFFFRMVRPYRVLRQLRAARTAPARRALMDAAALTGAGWLVHQAMSARVAVRTAASRCETQPEDSFGSWADELWEQVRSHYGFIALRSSRALNDLYGPRFPRLSRLRMRREGVDIGWACGQLLPYSQRPGGDRHFGNLTVGIVTDALARPADAGPVMVAAYDHLAASGADIVVTYHAHPAWIAATRHAGFREGPSNHAFYRSPAAERLLQAPPVIAAGWHIMASDGDGPKQL